MITFAGGLIDTDTLYHENMHQWWGDNVTEGGYHMTFFKEGMATLGEFLYPARLAENQAGGPALAPRAGPRSRPAWSSSSTRSTRSGGSFWTVAPSNPKPFGLFAGSSTYDRPGAAYIALRQILGTGQVHPGAAADPAPLRRRHHHRGAAGGGLPPVAAGAERGLPGAAQPVLHPVVRHRLPARRRQQPARRSPGPGLAGPASTTAAAARSACPQEARRRTMMPLSRAMASRSAAVSLCSRASASQSGR